MPKQVTTERRLFPIILHREEDVWGYVSPEFGGGGAASQADALAKAQDLLNAAVAELQEAGATLPTPEEDPDPEGGRIVWLPVTVTNAAERINITLPKTLLDRLDGVTENRSGFIAEVLRERLDGVS